MTRGTRKEHIVRATLESIAYQTRDVAEAMEADSGIEVESLRVDGGAVKNNFLCQLQSDILGTDIVRPVVDETTALGSAYAAGLAVGYWETVDELRDNWQVDREFEVNMESDEADAKYGRWQDAVERSLDWATRVVPEMANLESLWAIEMLIAAFAGGAFGAAVGALPAFIFTGFMVIAGEAANIVGRYFAAAGPGKASELGAVGITGSIAFGPVFSPAISFAAGAAAAAYAAKRGYMETGFDFHEAKNIAFAQGTKPDVLVVGGVFGIFGYWFTPVVLDLRDALRPHRDGRRPLRRAPPTRVRLQHHRQRQTGPVEHVPVRVRGTPRSSANRRRRTAGPRKPTAGRRAAGSSSNRGFPTSTSG